MKIITILSILIMLVLMAWTLGPPPLKSQELEEFIKAREEAGLIAETKNQQCLKAFEQDFPEHKDFGCYYSNAFDNCTCKSWERRNAWEKEHTKYDGDMTLIKEIRFDLKN